MSETNESIFWTNIHTALGKLIGDVRYVKSNKNGLMSVYMGNVRELKKDCLKIINLIECYEGDTYDGMDEKSRR